MNHRLKYETIVVLALILSCLAGCTGQERIICSSTDAIGLSLPWSSDEPSGGSSLDAVPAETLPEEGADEEATPGEAHEGPAVRHELSVFGGATSHGSKHGGTVGGE